MPSLLELVRSHTDLDEADVAVLQLLTADWQIIADLSFADLVLWLPDRGGDGFWAAAQMRPTVEGLTPTSLASDLRLQCVAPVGLAVSVSLTIRERIEAAIGAIRPGRVLSLRMPANPICTYRCRQRPTFPGSCPNRTAIFLFSRPSAASKIIAALSLARTGLFLPLLSFSNVMRSLTDSSMLAATRIRNV